MGVDDTDDMTQAVLTCQGDIDDPEFPKRRDSLFLKLQQVLENDCISVTKCEPWNSVKITFDLPRDAADKLAKLAESGDDALRELGILSLQVEGGQIISITMVNNDDGPSDAPSTSSAKSSPSKSSESSSSSSKCSSDSPSTNSVDLHNDKSAPPPPYPSSKSDLHVGAHISYAGTTKHLLNMAGSNHLPMPPKFPVQQNSFRNNKDDIGLGRVPASPKSPLLVNLLQKDGVDSPVESKKQRRKPVRKKPNDTVIVQSSSQGAITSIDSVKVGLPQKLSSGSHSISSSSSSRTIPTLVPPPPIRTNTQDFRQGGTVAALSAAATAAAAKDKLKQILINPNTGLLESGPSESSSEGENESDLLNSLWRADVEASGGGAAAAAARAAAVHNAADKALKLKLKLPVERKHVPKHLNTAAAIQNAAAVAAMGNSVFKKLKAADSHLVVRPSVNKKPTSTETETDGGIPKVPKLILSMKDKKVKLREGDTDRLSSAEDPPAGTERSEEELRSRIEPSNNSVTAASRGDDLKQENGPQAPEDEKTEQIKAEVLTKVETITEDLKDVVSKGSSKEPSLDETTNATSISADVKPPTELVNPFSFGSKPQDDIIKADDDVIEPAPSIVPKEEETPAFPLAPDPIVAYSPSAIHRDASNDQQAHQGEDSGIESMDALSEKSPNQGESPFRSTDLDVPPDSKPPLHSAVVVTSSSNDHRSSSSESSSPTSSVHKESPCHKQESDNVMQSSINSNCDGTYDPPAVVSGALSDEGKDFSEAPEAPPDPPSLPQTNNTSAPSTTSDSNSTHQQSSDQPEQQQQSVVVEQSELVNGISPNHPRETPTPPPPQPASTTVIDTATTTVADTPPAIVVDTAVASMPAVTSLQSLISSATKFVSSSSTLTSSAAGGVGLQVRSTLSMPPGAKMVPVKLVTVSGGDGAVRVVRVSPVKHSHEMTPGARTVLIKSSLLKAATVSPTATTGSTATVAGGSVMVTTIPTMTLPTPPAVESTIVASPVVKTPVVEAPVVGTPIVDAPSVETSIVGTSTIETPTVETAIVATPVVDTSTVEETPDEVETPTKEAATPPPTPVEQQQAAAAPTSNHLPPSSAPDPIVEETKADDNSTSNEVPVPSSEEAKKRTVVKSATSPKRPAAKTVTPTPNVVVSTDTSPLRISARQQQQVVSKMAAMEAAQLEADAEAIMEFPRLSKRKRRDTDSSTKSDRSDLSEISLNGKKAKLENNEKQITTNGNKKSEVESPPLNEQAKKVENARGKSTRGASKKADDAESTSSRESSVDRATPTPKAGRKLDEGPRVTKAKTRAPAKESENKKKASPDLSKESADTKERRSNRQQTPTKLTTPVGTTRSQAKAVKAPSPALRRSEERKIKQADAAATATAAASNAAASKAKRATPTSVATPTKDTNDRRMKTRSASTQDETTDVKRRRLKNDGCS